MHTLATAGVPMMDSAAREAIRVWFQEIEDGNTREGKVALAVTSARTASSRTTFAVYGQPALLDVGRRATSVCVTLVLERTMLSGQCDPATPGCNKYLRIPPPNHPSP